MPPMLSSPTRHCDRARSSAVTALAVVLQDEFNTPFSFYDASTGERLEIGGESEDERALHADERSVLRTLAGAREPAVVCMDDGGYWLGFPLDGFGPARVLAVGIVSALGKSEAERTLEQSRIGRWARAVHGRLLAHREANERQRAQAEQERQALCAWKAVMGLDRLHRSLRTHDEPVRQRRRILRGAADILGTQSLAWVSLHGEGDVILEGESVLSPWDCGQIASQLAEQTHADDSSYALVNEPSESRWGAQYPQVMNLLAVRVAHEGHSAWVLAINKTRAQTPSASNKNQPFPEAPATRRSEEGAIEPFCRSDVMLLLPFASLLGLHLRAAQDYMNIKSMLIGFTRALTAAIDAKDAYTYGHSERVARVAVELARELGQHEAEQGDIYLVGLLHDIGKIGIKDAILAKREPLTADEIAQLRQHPVIGHRILADLHGISHLLGGVLHHHELYDGGGYPAGLRGEAIPFLARILAVADSFDAMNTARPYRDALPPERVDATLRAGAGAQWDPRVIDAYFRCRDRLIAIRQRGLGASLDAALDGALRKAKLESDFASIQHTVFR